MKIFAVIYLLLFILIIIAYFINHYANCINVLNAFDSNYYYNTHASMKSLMLNKNKSHFLIVKQKKYI